MKLYFKEITHCFACQHHFRWDYKKPNQKMMCTTCQYREILNSEVDTHGKDFPEWCPLPNKQTIDEYPADYNGG